MIGLLDGFLPAFTERSGIWTLDGNEIRWRGVLLTVLLIPPLLGGISAEEKLLRSHFGAEYQALCAHTARLIPGIY